MGPNKHRLAISASGIVGHDSYHSMQIKFESSEANLGIQKYCFSLFGK